MTAGVPLCERWSENLHSLTALQLDSEISVGLQLCFASFLFYAHEVPVMAGNSAPPPQIYYVISDRS